MTPPKEYTVKEILSIIKECSYTNLFISEVATINLDYLTKVLNGKQSMGSGMKAKLTKFIHTHIED